MKKRRRGATARPTQPPAPAEPSRGTARPHWALAGVLVASTAVAGLSSPVFAQAPSRQANDGTLATRSFDIPAGSLAEALAAFTLATGINVTDPSALIGSERSPGVSGRMTVDEALSQLLGETRLGYRFTSARTLRLERTTSTTTRRLAGVTVTAEGVRERRVSSPKYTEPLRDVPQTVNVVTSEVLVQQGATSLRDALRNVSGLTVNAGEGGVTPGDNFNVRGFSARGDIFVDGVRDVGGFSRETFNIEQVEVAKGPGSTYTGRGSTGGSINLVTKSPQARPSYAATLGAGSADFGRATIDVNQPIGADESSRTALRMNAVWQDAGVPGLDVVKNRNWGVAPSLAFGVGTPTRLTVQYLRNEQDNTPSYGIMSFDSLPTVDTRNFFGLNDIDRENVQVDQASVRAEHDVNGGLTLRNQLGWGRREVDRVVTFANAAGGARSSRSHLTEDGNVTNQTTLTGRFATGAVRHALVTGLDLSRERSKFAGYTFTATPPAVGDLTAPNPNDPYTGQVVARRPTRDATSTTVGVYAFETARLGEHWEITGGLRYDDFRAEYQDSLGVALDPAGTTTRALTWRAGTVYKPVEHGSIYAAYGTSFNPSGELLALDSRGTAGLDPEKNRSVEIGTKWDLASERLSLTAAAFRTEKTNARMTNPDDPSGPQILAGDQRVDGAELGASGRVTTAWTVIGGYTWMDSEIIAGAAADVGNPLPNTPKHSANLWSTYTFPWRLEVGAGGRYVGERFVRGTFWVPSYQAFDATAAYPVTRRVTLRLNLYNLSDETYYDTGRFWVPAPGRSVRVTANVQY